MITCNFCGAIFHSIEDYEKHIDAKCFIAQANNSATNPITGIIYPNGRIGFKTLKTKFLEVNTEKPTDESLQRKRTDKDLTEPPCSLFIL